MVSGAARRGPEARRLGWFALGAAAVAAAAVLGSLPGRGHALKADGVKSWFKGNTHAHTLWSDGDGAPEVVVAWYRKNQYDFLCLSDHNILSRGEKWFEIEEQGRLTEERVQEIRAAFGKDWLELRERGGRTEMRLKTLGELRRHFEAPEEFLLIQAEEITSGRPSVHVNGMNLEELIAPARGGSVSEAIEANIEAVEEQGRRLGIATLAHLNHPNWSAGISAEDIIAAGAERFFEVYNGHSGVRNWGSRRRGFPSTDRLWDIVLSMRLNRNAERPLYGLGTDDSHHYFDIRIGKTNPGRGWVVVLAEELSAEAIIGAMKRGDFYASSGVELEEIAWDKKTLSIAIRAKEGVAYKTQFIGTLKGFDDSSRAFTDSAGNEAPRATRIYSDQIGRVLGETSENPAVYRIAGNELYVRAKVVSTKLQVNPFAEGDFETAWTQPVVGD